ncbi:tetratricopeptide repeat protein [Streptomyces sp. NPDC017966]|uniref:tetratricopeptide repeat protein n=1 Tax=unclassified Streptomyces TaxID=2593676 RepID=UPI001C2378B0|nr:tetratricopeptide repeat protein [Streptomyces sp. AC558_RSS880]
MTARGTSRRSRTVGLIGAWVSAAACAATLDAVNSPEPWVIGVGAAVGTAGSVLSLLATTVLQGDGAVGGAPDHAAPTAIRQLPAATDHFTGRWELVKHIRRLVLGPGLPKRWRRRGAGRSDRLRVVTLWGRGGVGKTALAVRLGHELARDFPDGQMYVDLRGASDTTSRAPGDILAVLLRDLGVDPEAVPEDLDDRMRLFRSRTAGLRLLIVLDNARDETQVRPLLPGGTASLVIVTSRPRLSGLEGGTSFELSVLEHDQAVELLGKLAGVARVAAEPAAASQIVRACGLLPLAVRIAGARLAGRPAWSLENFARRLATQHRRLGELQAGSLDVRTSITVGYNAQSAVNQRAFLLLALCDAPTFSVLPLQAAMDCPRAQAERVLDELAEAQMLEWLGHNAVGQSVYRYHDLVRDYAFELLTGQVLGGDERRAALRRVVGHCLSLTERAERRLTPGSHRRTARFPRWSAPPEDGGPETEPDVLQQLASEYEFLLCAVREARDAGMTTAASELASLLVAHQDTHALWSDWERTQCPVLEACRADGDELGVAVSLRDLAVLRRLQGRLSEAEQHGLEALAIFERVGEAADTADCLSNLGWLYRVRGEHDKARLYLARALSVAERCGIQRTRGWVLQMHADLEIDAGALDTALALLRQSREVFEDIGERRGLGWTLRITGDVHRKQEQYDQALTHYQAATDLLRTHEDRRGIARILDAIGALYECMGRAQDAVRHYEDSLAAFRQLGDIQWQAYTLDALAGLCAALGEPAKADSYRTEAAALLTGLTGGETRAQPARRL